MKKIICLLSVLLLVACNNQDNLPVAGEEASDQILLAQRVESLEITLNQMSIEINEKVTEINDLREKISDLEGRISSPISTPYKDYLITFSYDVINSLKNFSTYQGIISDYDLSKNTMDVVPIEFIYCNDEENLKKFNVDIQSTPRHGDVYMFINYAEKTTYSLSDNCRFYIYDWEGDRSLMEKSVKVQLESMTDINPILTFSILDEQIIRITERLID